MIKLVSAQLGTQFCVTVTIQATEGFVLLRTLKLIQFVGAVTKASVIWINMSLYLQVQKPYVIYLIYQSNKNVQFKYLTQLPLLVYSL